jgi:hypothetical protein
VGATHNSRLKCYKKEIKNMVVTEEYVCNKMGVSLGGVLPTCQPANMINRRW